VTLTGIVTLVKLHKAKALSIEVTLLGKIILFSWVHHSNILSEIVLLEVQKQ